GHIGDDLFGGGVDDAKGTAVLGIAPLAVDEHLLAGRRGRGGHQEFSFCTRWFPWVYSSWKNARGQARSPAPKLVWLPRRRLPAFGKEGGQAFELEVRL